LGQLISQVNKNVLCAVTLLSLLHENVLSDSYIINVKLHNISNNLFVNIGNYIEWLRKHKVFKAALGNQLFFQFFFHIFNSAIVDTQ